jgi:hypothetical protein
MTQVVSATAPQTMPTTGRWGWYKDHEGNEFRRVSKLLEHLETKPGMFNLIAWFKRQAALGVAQRPDLATALAAMGRQPAAGWSREDKKAIDELVSKAEEAAKISDGGVLGTAMHKLTERVDRGEDIEVVAQGLAAVHSQSLRAYAALIKLNDWKVTEIERTVQVPAFENVTGTLDREYVVPGLAALLGPGDCQYGHAAAGEVHFSAVEAGELPLIGDVKTEGDPLLNAIHIAPQLATYSRAPRMWSPAGYEDAPCVRQDVGIMVHVRDGAAVPYFVDLGRGWTAVCRAFEQMIDERDAKRKLGVAGAWFVAMPNIVEPKPAELLTQVAVAADYANPNRPPDHKVPGEVGDTLAQGGVLTHEAVRLPDGAVGWLPVPAAPAQHGSLDEVDKSAVEAVWAAADLPSLAETYRIYTEVCGRQWGGRVAEAAEARRRQIECAQRALHTGGKCACGWTQGVAP